MIPNIVKGRGISGALAYAMGEKRAAAEGKYSALAAVLGERSEIIGGQNFGFDIDSAERVEMARRMMEWNGMEENQASRGRKCEKDCLHASLSWEKGYEPSREEMADAAQGFLKTLGMEGAQAVYIGHNDTDHRHLHIIASRLDPVTGKTYSQEDDFAKAQAWGIRYEREHNQIPQSQSRQALHKLAGAIEARDAEGVLAHLTDRTPTFTPRELDKALVYGGLSKEDRAAFRADILANHNTIGLRETAEADVSRYTTREVLAAEMGVVRSAQQLADDKGHGLTQTRIEATAAAYTLKPEQAEALDQLAGPEGFAMLWGQAGTGKSHTLNAVRSAYEAEGARVIGMSWTNDVVQQMRGDGFQNAATIASELAGIRDGRTSWDRNTVLIVDEAAMVSTRTLGQLFTAARDAGAKLIVAGDDHQLASIERGGMFETLRQTHGAAVLSDVQRVQAEEQKGAFNGMHRGDFKEALRTFDEAGGLQWSDKQAEVIGRVAANYAEDVAAAPDKRRFMFAVTNDEVGELNRQARALHKERGDLGQDVTLGTQHGRETFAAGDRIQFSGNGYSKKQKNAGLTNGRVGTIKEIDITGEKPRVTVELDTARGKPAKVVSFTVGDNGKAGEFDTFKLGYAGTIYRGQGKTLDETYVAHSSQWRQSAAYVALTRHRENVHIFAARETVADLEQMATQLARPENKRAATAYEIDDRSALRIDFTDVAEATAAAGSDPTQSLRGFDRVRAFLEAQRHNSQVEQGSPETATEPAEPLTAAERHKARVAAFLAKEQREFERSDATLALARMLGREITAGDEPDIELVADFMRMARQDQDGAAQALQELSQRIGYEVTAEQAAGMTPGTEGKTAAQRDAEDSKQALQELARAIGRTITGEEATEQNVGRDRGGGISL